MLMCRCCGAPAQIAGAGSECCGASVEESVPCSVCGAPISPTWADWGMCVDCETKTRIYFEAFVRTMNENQREMLKYEFKKKED